MPTEAGPDERATETEQRSAGRGGRGRRAYQSSQDTTSRVVQAVLIACVELLIAGNTAFFVNDGVEGVGEEGLKECLGIAAPHPFGAVMQNLS